MDMDGLRALVVVVEEGSFVSGARRLGMTRATLRRRVEELEAHVGRPLLLRNHQGAAPTEAGLLLARQGRRLLEETQVLLAAAREVDESPRGQLRIMLPVGMAPHLLMSLGMLLRQKFPQLSFHLRMADDPALAARLGDVDMAVHFGDVSPEGPWVSMEIARLRRWLVASPDYLRERGTPETPEALAGHELLSWVVPGEDGLRWPLRGGGAIAIAPALVSSDIHMLRQAASMGMGIAWLPDAMLPDPGPPLVPVLSEQVSDEQSLRVLIPTALEQLPRIRAVIQEVRQLRITLGLFSS